MMVLKQEELSIGDVTVESDGNDVTVNLSTDLITAEINLRDREDIPKTSHVEEAWESLSESDRLLLAAESVELAMSEWRSKGV